MDSPFLKTKTLETTLNFYELDSTNILHVHTKPVEITTEIFKENQTRLEAFLNGEKVKMLVNATDSQTLTAEQRKIVNADMKRTCKAVALISSSTIGLLVSKVFISLMPKPVPMKLFSDKQMALKWLRDMD